MANFKQVYVTNTSNGKTVVADVLHSNDKALKVVLVNTTITIFLSRTDLNKAFVGRIGSMEFTSNGEIL